MKLPEEFGFTDQSVDAVWPIVAESAANTLFTTFDPARPDTQIARYDIANPAQIDSALKRSVESFKQWSSLTCAARVTALSAWLDRIEKHTESIAICMTAEQGKPLAESRGEIGKCLRESRQMLGFAGSHGGTTLPGRTAGFRNIVMRRPLGVALAIAPWNFPVLTPMRKLVPALVSGNSVVLKPSEFSPAAAIALAHLSNGILPEGVLSVVQGNGEVAASLNADERIKAVSFTGSVETGRVVAAKAASGLKRVSLELGGKNGAILDAVENLDAALDGIVAAAFQCSGQRCTSISRIIVNRSVLQPVTIGLRQRLDSLVAGHGSEATTTLGPITTASQLEKIEALVNTAIASGAVCLQGGKRLVVDTCPSGQFFEPTLLQVEDATNVAAQDEIFGPVLTIQPYDTDDEAMALLNSTRFGLTSSVFTDRVRFAARALAETQSGMIHINHGTVPDDNMPFVGIGDSGLGIGSVGPSTLDFYTSEHSAYLADN